MKIAIVFSGYFRTFEFVKETCKNFVLDPLDCDVFFVSPKTYFAHKDNEVPEFHHIHSQNEEFITPKIIDFFGDKLKSYELRDGESNFYKQKIIQHGMPEKNIHNQYHWRTLAQIHYVSMSMSHFKNYVKNNNVNYDLVILARADVKYHTSFDLNRVNMDKINYPTTSVFEGRLSELNPNAGPSPHLTRAFNDQMLVGSPNNMFVLGAAYDNIINYNLKEGISFNTETLLGLHILKSGVDFIGTDYILYELWRKNQY